MVLHLGNLSLLYWTRPDEYLKDALEKNFQFPFVEASKGGKARMTGSDLNFVELVYAKRTKFVWFLGVVFIISLGFSIDMLAKGQYRSVSLCSWTLLLIYWQGVFLWPFISLIVSGVMIYNKFQMFTIRLYPKEGRYRCYKGKKLIVYVLPWLFSIRYLI